MTPFGVLTATAVPLLQENIDTDTIIRVEPLFGGVPRDALGPYALAALRFHDDGRERADCVLNRAPYRHAGILVAGENFGCGSSREGAVWALMAMGLRCVIAPSFGDIFYGNCFQNGMLPVQLPRAQVEALAQAATDAPHAPLTIDLAAGTIHREGHEPVAFALPARRREGLLRGLDDLELTLARQAEIDAFRSRAALQRPWLFLDAVHPPLDPLRPTLTTKETQ